MENITKINGPVSVDLLRSPNNKVTFYLFGDLHFSKDQGCMNTSNSIDIDTAFYRWLVNNNSNHVKTDLLIESSYSPEDKKTSTIDWMDACETLQYRKEDFSPYSAVTPIDVRINNITGKSDILSYLYVEILTANMLSENERVELLKISQIIFSNAVRLFDAYTRVNGFSNISVIRNKIQRLDRSRIRDRCLHNLNKMEDYFVNIGNTRGHFVAKALSDLASFNKVTSRIASLNLGYYRSMYIELSEELTQFNIDTELSLSVSKYSSIKEVNDIIFSSRIQSINTELMTMSGWVMDIYLMTSAFLSRSTEKIVYVGKNHVKGYVELLREIHGYNHLVHVENSSSDSIRCLDATDLIEYVDALSM